MQEFEKLEPSNDVYKLIGPVLVKQDQAEAKTNVNTRLDFIKGEMQVVSDSLLQGWSLIISSQKTRRGTDKRY